MKNLLRIFLLGAILFTASCKKETDIESLAKKLQNVIQSEHVERVLYSTVPVGDPSNWMIFGDYGKNYHFDPPLITIEDHVYNLAAMKSYEVATLSNHICLVLEF